jgi:hypothetical protein
MPTPPAQDLPQAHLHAWALEALGSSSALLQLYTQLGDARQRRRAICIFDAATAWLAQFPAKLQRLPPRPPIHQDDHRAELGAWRSALGASTGILLFLTLAQDATKPVPGLRGRITSFTHASKAALQGLQCAFPEDLAESGTTQAIASVLDVCRQVFARDFPDEADLVDSLLAPVRKSLESWLGA